MKVILLIFCFCFTSIICLSQCVNTSAIIGSNRSDVPVFVKQLFADSLVSSFYIEVKKEVKLHKHNTHSEHVFILKGKGKMQLGDSSFMVKPNDFIFIPKNTPHKLIVKGKKLICLSIQAPFFDGKDREMLE